MPKFRNGKQYLLPNDLNGCVRRLLFSAHFCKKKKKKKKDQMKEKLEAIAGSMEYTSTII